MFFNWLVANVVQGQRTKICSVVKIYSVVSPASDGQTVWGVLACPIPLNSGNLMPPFPSNCRRNGEEKEKLLFPAVNSLFSYVSYRKKIVLSYLHPSRLGAPSLRHLDPEECMYSVLDS